MAELDEMLGRRKTIPIGDTTYPLRQLTLHEHNELEAYVRGAPIRVAQEKIKHVKDTLGYVDPVWQKQIIDHAVAQSDDYQRCKDEVQDAFDWLCHILWIMLRDEYKLTKESIADKLADDWMDYISDSVKEVDEEVPKDEQDKGDAGDDSKKKAQTPHHGT